MLSRRACTRSEILVRDATPADLPAIEPIYAHAVLTGLASFEEIPPGIDELRRRYEEVIGRGLPYFAAEVGGRVVGYGYCAPYRTRSAYRYTLEDSVYVAPYFHGRGVGRALLTRLIERCEALGYRQMIAVIGDSGNAASIGLHASLGFVRAGMLRSCGYKFGRWVDSVLMQRALGPADGAPPAAR